MRHGLPTWLPTRWSKQERRRRILETAALEQEAECARARARLIAMSSMETLAGDPGSGVEKIAQGVYWIEKDPDNPWTLSGA